MIDLPALAADLVTRRLNVIVAAGEGAALAGKSATSAIRSFAAARGLHYWTRTCSGGQHRSKTGPIYHKIL